ncbi:MAG: hypothetical protein JSS56_23145 [Proteobacteria bacterium]|nr:hypothetical protein [Pseudomonadota bacterium]
MTDVIASARPAATRVTKRATAVTKAATGVAPAPTAALGAQPSNLTSTPRVTSGNAMLGLDRRFDPTSQLLEAEAAIAAVEVCTALHWAILRLIGAAQAELAQASEKGPERLEVASQSLEEVMAVINAVEDGLDDSLVYAAGTLITLAKAQIDATLEQQAVAAANGGAA